MKIEKIYTYPIKALRAVSLDSAQVTKHGFPHDRRFMVLQVLRDEAQNRTTYKNIHVAYFPESVFFHPSLDLEKGTVTVEHKPPNGPERKVTFDLRPDTDGLEVVEVEMHKSPTTAYKMPQEYSDWFSECYGFEVVLAYLGHNYRPVLMSTSHNKQPSTSESNGWLSSITSTASSYILGKEKDVPGEITFADCAPYLIASSTSIQDLSPRLSPDNSIEADILKFRPNIIISGALSPWDEDFWGQLTISPSTNTLSSPSPITIECIHNCGRCKSINIDYTTGAPATDSSGELLKRMQKDRRVDPGMKYSPIFGRYSFLGEGSEGKEIKVGDEVVVSKKLGERSVFDWKGLATA